MIDRLADLWTSRKKLDPRLWRWLTALLTAAMAVYLVYALTQGSLRLNQIDWRAYGLAVAVAFLLYLLSVLLQFAVWARLLSFSRRITWLDIHFYFRMVLLRSLPGGAWHWVGRLGMYSGSTDVPPRTIIVGTFLEWSLLTLTGGGIYFCTLPNLFLGIPLALLCFGVFFWLAIAWQPASRHFPARFLEAASWLILYSLCWIVAASGILYVIVSGVSGPGKLKSFESLHIWTLTGSLGQLTVLLPSSLGVREISLLFLLKGRLAASVALLIALMIRLIYTLADVFWGTLGTLFTYFVLHSRHVLEEEKKNGIGKNIGTLKG